MMNSASLEREMRDALGITEQKKVVVTPKDRQNVSFQRKLDDSPKTKKKEKLSEAKPNIRLTYRVRKKTGGEIKYFVHESPSISMFEAELEADKILDKEGLMKWVVIDKEFLN